MRNGVTIIMPTYNEAKNVTRAAESAISVCERLKVPFELIIVNDASTDETARIVKLLARKHAYIRIIDDAVNRGFGYAFRRGLAVAAMPYVCVFPSDNEMSKESFGDLVKARHRADFISTYMANPLMRTLERRIISHAFVTTANILFHLNLRYYTGPFICKTPLAKRTRLISDGFTMPAELRIRLIGAGCSYREIPFMFSPRTHGRTSIFRIRTIYQTLKTLVVLLVDDFTGRLRHV